MIIKFFETKKKDLSSFKYFLLYGKNKGLIEETIQKDFKKFLPKNTYKYDENEILNDLDNFRENIFNKSFFDNDKLVIIQRVSDKILKVIEELKEKEVEDVAIILISDQLEKKSKLRAFFEKDKKTICIAFYEDTNQTLSFIVQNFLKKLNINLSQQNINVIVGRAKGDRASLNNELMKLESYAMNKSNINVDDILKLTNLAENYDAAELVENSLAQNQKQTLHILNENNFSNEDCIMIIRIYLNKLKRLLKIISDMKTNNDVNQVIMHYRPPIFWKEKDFVKKQVKIWNYENISELISKTNLLELQLKKNPTISIYLLTNFILEKTLNVNN